MTLAPVAAAKNIRNVMAWSLLAALLYQRNKVIRSVLCQDRKHHKSHDLVVSALYVVMAGLRPAFWAMILILVNRAHSVLAKTARFMKNGLMIPVVHFSVAGQSLRATCLSGYSQIKVV